MNRFHRLLATGVAAVALLAMTGAPGSAQTSLDLLGDKDCFGSGWTCVEDGSTWIPGGWSAVVAEIDDPYPTDQRWSGGSPTWSHSFSPGVASAFLEFRTAGIADIGGPYDVFVDGLMVGSLPYDGYGHILVETFSFALAPSILADGMATVEIRSIYGGDAWAIDYSEILTRDQDEPVVTTPEPGSVAIFAVGLFGLAFVAWRREELPV